MTERTKDVEEALDRIEAAALGEDGADVPSEVALIRNRFRALDSEPGHGWLGLAALIWEAVGRHRFDGGLDCGDAECREYGGNSTCGRCETQFHAQEAVQAQRWFATTDTKEARDAE